MIFQINGCAGTMLPCQLAAAYEVNREESQPIFSECRCTSSPAKLERLLKKAASSGRSTTKTPFGLSLLPLPTRYVFMPGGKCGARRGVKLLTRVPSRSRTTVSLPCSTQSLSSILQEQIQFPSYSLSYFSHEDVGETLPASEACVT